MAEVQTAYRELYEAMVAADTTRLDALLDESFTLTHMTGLVQPKRDWLAAIASGQMRYHATQEASVRVKVSGEQAQLVGQNHTDATIYGSHAVWPLQLTIDYAERGRQWIALNAVATTF
ncbi:nuclear transport factor 2 family protein [Luteococcus sp. H138]|uniref:nuclear transport factor 2 family protein n=1 Tax=unclassified Luteococcus TaxID=2639923 RepID=UPI00313F33F0